jgi:RHS repeat-associated protein
LQTCFEGPFGELLRAIGPIAKANPFRFSTKYQDDETDLLYYAYRYYSASTGRWLSRDPIDEEAFRLPSLKDFEDIDLPLEPNLYGFAANDPADEVDALGLVIVGFYGADTPFTFPNDGNKVMQEIAGAVKAPLFRSNAIYPAYRYLVNYFSSNGPGCTNLTESIKIFGHSWGGISAVKLARWVGRSGPLRNVALVAVIDPVGTLRWPPTSVPRNVQRFWNRYQTHGKGVTIIGRPVHGRRLRCHAQSGCEDQIDLNPGPGDNGIDHWSIVSQVKDELIGLLKQ